MPENPLHLFALLVDKLGDLIVDGDAFRRLHIVQGMLVGTSVEDAIHLALVACLDCEDTPVVVYALIDVAQQTLRGEFLPDPIKDTVRCRSFLAQA